MATYSALKREAMGQLQDKKIERLKDFLLKPAIVSEKDLGAQVKRIF